MPIAYTENGQGKPVILLHGFPMNRSVWSNFVTLLPNTLRVIAPDLPGFGESPLLTKGFSIEDVAQKILDFLDEKGITSTALVGHSLGGYVALAMIEKRPQSFSGLALFHSMAAADSDEKKDSRNKVVAFIETNGVEAFTSSFISPLFADPKHPAIYPVKDITMKASTDAVTGYTLAMRNRPDRQNVLINFDKPVLFLAGEKDAGIPVNLIYDQARLCPQPEVVLLSNVAHMGMFEKPEESAEVLSGFLARL